MERNDATPGTSSEKTIPVNVSSAPHGFREFQWFAYAGIYVVFDIARPFKVFGFDEFEKFRPGRGMDPWLFTARMGLFCTFLFLSALWIMATREEMEIWLDEGVVEKHEPKGTSLAILLIALCLGLSLAFVGNAILIGCFFGFATLVNALTSLHTDTSFAKGARAAQKRGLRLPEERYRRYWNYKIPIWRNKQFQRLVCMSVVSFIAAFLAANHRVLTAYCILIANILAGEAVMAWWRHHRDKPQDEPAKVDNPIAAADYAGILPWFAATLPLLSFFGQFYLSRHNQTLPLMLRHSTVMYADWILVLFNFFAVKVINWSRGRTIFNLTVLSTCLSVITHALWQAQRQDIGYMISKAGVVQPAGWVHLAFTILETTLLTAYIFCRKQSSNAATGCATAYFAAMFASGYWMHRTILFSDASVFVMGLLFLYGYARLAALWKA